MRDPDRLVAPVVELIDIEDGMPAPGTRVMAIGLGGCLAPVVWTKNSHEFFKAWMPYPKVPAKTKKKLMEHFNGGDPWKKAA